MRLELGGHGDPIPNIALPDPQLSADMPVQSLVLVNGSSFEKSDWVALGYTHYEVWCVGAVGGQGAEGGDPQIRDFNTPESVVMPDWMWESMIQAQVNYYAWAGMTTFPVYSFSTVPGHTGEVVVTYDTPREAAIKWLEQGNPDHLTQINHHHNPYVISDSSSPIIGGAGGGGGLHVVSGELADLPNSVPVVVGSAGFDALPGQIISPDSLDAYLAASTRSVESFTGQSSTETAQQFHDRYYFTNTWPEIGDPARPLLLPGQPGGDGGASAFGDICMASGGTGGGPAIVWVEGHRMFAAHGGEGGVGGRMEAGGGALGSTDSSRNGKDGSWDGTIGQGGGGGRGGMSEVKHETLDYSQYMLANYNYG